MNFYQPITALFTQKYKRGGRGAARRSHRTVSFCVYGVGARVEARTNHPAPPWFSLP